jgi:hypothetical protein
MIDPSTYWSCGYDLEPVVGELIAENVIPRLVQLADKTKKRDDHVVFESSRTISLLCILSGSCSFFFFPFFLPNVVLDA